MGIILGAQATVISIHIQKLILVSFSSTFFYICMPRGEDNLSQDAKLSIPNPCKLVMVTFSLHERFGSLQTKCFRFLLTEKEAYLTKLSVQGKTDAAYSADDICVNYTTEGQVTPGKSSCTVRRFI